MTISIIMLTIAAACNAFTTSGASFQKELRKRHTRPARAIESQDRWIGRKMTLKLCFTKRKVESAASHRGGMIAQLYSCTRASQRYLPTYLCRNR